MSFSPSSSHATFSRALPWVLLVLVTLLVCLLPHPAFAAGTDLFSSGKDDISATLFGDTVKYIIYGSAGIVGLLVGIFQKNWPMGAGIFFIAMIFWNVVESLLP